MLLRFSMVNVLFVILAISITAILFLSTKAKGIAAIATVIILAAITGYLAAGSLTGPAFEIVLSGPSMFGAVPVQIDALSAWFMLVINFTMLTGAFYGFNYMKKYRDRKSNITLHCIAFILTHFSLLGVCVVQNSFIFLLLWEVLALSVFILVIFENTNPTSIKAGINYLIQSHISIVFLMIGFLYYALKTNSYSFDAIAAFSSGQSSLAGTAIFLLFFIGFALKTGFIPFHTWLPYAHPAAPSHVSGIMSGVVIKIGIFGIMRMLLLIKTDFTTTGYFILAISIITGIYGVMLAIIQHDLKRLLAYHSIENIGIIGIGIGVGCIGLGATNKWMAILGFSGALLHTLNHSLFKSLLFYSAGNVLQATHTVSIEKLGGLIKKMPHTAILFLVASLAICGLPPLNGFISEFIIYGGLYNWLYSAGVFSQVAIIFALTGLVLIGGLAILCFTKAFSIVFLGTSRSESPGDVQETGKMGLVPMYITALFMVIIGLFPYFFLNALQQPVNLFTSGMVFNLNLIQVGVIDSLRTINWLFLGFIFLVIAMLWLRKLITRKRILEKGPTWGCGYPAEANRFQYTANGFVRTYTKLARPALDIEKQDVEIPEVFPSEKHYETHPYDKMERFLIDRPLKFINRIIEAFLFLQNGHLQRYILYGIIFIAAVICIPLLIDKFTSLLNLLKTL
jgi:formate hydrogenlyase subunit 3/multisubunit Na+/H+ antiporter MnhD subunit